MFRSPTDRANVPPISGFPGDPDPAREAGSPARRVVYAATFGCRFSVCGPFLRDDTPEDMTCGCSKYDYHDGTLICVSPGQIGGVEYNEKRFRIEGWALLFSLELLHGTPLDSRMKNFSFFPCQVNEALHMSAGERETFIAFLKLLREELEKPHDKRQEGCTPTEYVERIRCARNS